MKKVAFFHRIDVCIQKLATCNLWKTRAKLSKFVLIVNQVAVEATHAGIGCTLLRVRKAILISSTKPALEPVQKPGFAPFSPAQKHRRSNGWEPAQVPFELVFSGNIHPSKTTAAAIPTSTANVTGCT
jgi:hypothetical protein